MNSGRRGARRLNATSTCGMQTKTEDDRGTNAGYESSRDGA